LNYSIANIRERGASAFYVFDMKNQLNIFGSFDMLILKIKKILYYFNIFLNKKYILLELSPKF